MGQWKFFCIGRGRGHPSDFRDSFEIKPFCNLLAVLLELVEQTSTFTPRIMPTASTTRVIWTTTATITTTTTASTGNIAIATTTSTTITATTTTIFTNTSTTIMTDTFTITTTATTTTATTTFMA
eukprot:6097846-Pyramimonas_sp.AAC.1